MGRVVNLLLRTGADETVVDDQGVAPIGRVGRLGLSRNADRVRRLLANAAADRAWRRRGYLAMCRAHSDRLLQPQPPSGQPCGGGGVGWKSGSRAKEAKEDVRASGSSVGDRVAGEGIAGKWGSVAVRLVELE